MYNLREIERKDIIAINKWRNDIQLIDLLGAPFRYINVEVEQKWFDSYMMNRGNTVRCAIVTRESDDIIGLVSLTGIDFMNQSAHLHIMIGDTQKQGIGIGAFAVKEMLMHAFNNLNLNRIELGVLESNERAIHVYEKIGFKREGIKRDAVYKKGKFVNLLMYSILKNEFCC